MFCYDIYMRFRLHWFDVTQEYVNVPEMRVIIIVIIPRFCQTG